MNESSSLSSSSLFSEADLRCSFLFSILEDKKKEEANFAFFRERRTKQGRKEKFMEDWQRTVVAYLHIEISLFLSSSSSSSKIFFSSVSLCVVLFRSYNYTFSSFFRVDEECTYTAHPDDPSKTLYTQTATYKVFGLGTPINKALEGVSKPTSSSSSSSPRFHP